MKTKIFKVAALVLASGFFAVAYSNQAATNESTLQNNDPKHKAAVQQSDVLRLSEAFGHLIGRNLDNPGVTFDLDSIIKGMRDAAAGVDSPMSDQEYEEMMVSIQEQAFNDMAESNLADAERFLRENSSKSGVSSTAQGKIQYEVLSQGNGEAVSETSAPTIKYTGSYIDGTTFGSSDEAGGPITLPLEQTIAGFREGIVGMKAGEKRKIYIHPEMGYGVSGHLAPNSLLVFEVEVISAGNAEPKAAATAAKETAQTDASTSPQTNQNPS